MVNEDETRLAALYAGMFESELMDTARVYDELTETAKTLLRAEFKRRSLEPPLVQEEEPQPYTESRELVTVGRYRDLTEAIVARTALEMAGISCFLADEYMVRMQWQLSNFLGGTRLQVVLEDEAAALAVLSEPLSDTMAVGDEAEYEQPVCPKCGTLDVKLDDADRKVVATSFLIGIPLPHRKAVGEVWKCQKCGCRWMDDGETDEAGS